MRLTPSPSHIGIRRKPVPLIPFTMPANGEGKHRLLPPMDSPPPKRYKSESLPSSDAGRSRYYLSQSAQPSERGRSRQTSTAMDIYSITNKDPVERERRDNRWYSSNGSVASHPSQPSSRSPRALTPGRKYGFLHSRVCRGK